EALPEQRLVAHKNRVIPLLRLAELLRKTAHELQVQIEAILDAVIDPGGYPQIWGGEDPGGRDQAVHAEGLHLGRGNDPRALEPGSQFKPRNLSGQVDPTCRNP